MKRIILFLLLSTPLLSQAEYWGATGHRVVGLIAERHLSKKALKNIELVLKNETLAEVSTYMDFIRSDRQYDHLGPWHYCTIPDGMTYKQAGTPEEGDVIAGIQRLTEELKTKNFTIGDEAFTLKCLVHLIGDIHQPLHVGNGEDRGGNDVEVNYFYRNSNLHRVWDSGIIDEQQLSYTEYADWIDHASPEDLSQWQKDGVLVWASESYDLREQVYTMPEDKRLSWRYNYDNISIVNQRLLQAGLRLAKVLEDIYG